MEKPQTVTLNNGVVMPAIGLGVWQMSDGEETDKAISAALGQGYRLIDTAAMYGNERSVGEAVRESGVPRSDIFVTTKLWNRDHGYERALKAFDASLERLGLEYIDLYLIHWPGSNKRIETWKALEQIYKTGKAKAIGVSNFTITHLAEIAAEKMMAPAVNQVEFHPFIYNQQKALLEYCKNMNIVFEAYSPLARGRHINFPLFDEIGLRHGKSPAQIMLRWGIQHGSVVIPKSSTPSRINENFDIFDFELSSEEMTQINSLSTGHREAWDPTTID